MKSFKKIISTLTLVIVMTPFHLYAQAGSGGKTGLSFLKFGVGGRASAMGEAFTAVVNDAYSTFWNPAGLAGLQQSQLVFTHTEWLQDISNEFFAFAFPAFGGGVGVSVYTNNVNGIQRRTTSSAQPIGSVDANDVAFSISYGKNVAESIQAGVTVKYLYEKIFTESSSGYAVDLGVKYHIQNSPLQVGFVVQNLGSMSKLVQESVDLPKTFRGGIQYQIALEDFGSSFIFAIDGVKTVDTDFHTNFGAELLLKQKIYLRVGYQAGFDQKSVGGGLGLTFHRYQLDYGYTPFDSNFGEIHRFSFALNL